MRYMDEVTKIGVKTFIKISVTSPQLRNTSQILASKLSVGVTCSFI